VAGVLRIQLKGRDIVFHRSVSRRDAKEACREHLQMFRRVMVPSDKSGANGRRLYDAQEIPADDWIFTWVENPGSPEESTEPLTLG
jgi:hypothetical protein